MHFTNFYNEDLKNALDENFSNIVTENVGPFIYSTIKTIRPKKILEIVAGYTSIFFAQALKEIEEENDFEAKLLNEQKIDPNWERRHRLLHKDYQFSADSKLIIVDNKNKEIAQFNVPYGANMFVSDGDKVKAGLRLLQWDPYTDIILARETGKVILKDFIEGETYAVEAVEG